MFLIYIDGWLLGSSVQLLLLCVEFVRVLVGLVDMVDGTLDHIFKSGFNVVSEILFRLLPTWFLVEDSFKDLL